MARLLIASKLEKEIYVILFDVNKWKKKKNTQSTRICRNNFAKELWKKIGKAIVNGSNYPIRTIPGN